jgi:hypothetical protein
MLAGKSATGATWTCERLASGVVLIRETNSGPALALGRVDARLLATFLMAVTTVTG